MPVFTIQGKDVLAVLAVEAYEDLCIENGLHEQANEVRKAKTEIQLWQENNPDLEVVETKKDNDVGATFVLYAEQSGGEPEAEAADSTKPKRRIASAGVWLSFSRRRRSTSVGAWASQSWRNAASRSACSV